MTTLTFRNTVLETISHNSHIWFTSSELAKALEYASCKSVTDIYNKNSDEFTTGMSEGVESTTSLFGYVLNALFLDVDGH